MQGRVQTGKPNAECAALLNKRVRVKAEVAGVAGLTGTVANVCPDKLGAPYQVHVKIDGDDGHPYIFSPDEIEPETVQ